REREVGNRLAQLRDETQVPLAAVGAAHRLQDARRTGLQRQMRMLADGAAFGHRVDHRPTEVLRVRAREANALDPLDRAAGTEQLPEFRMYFRCEIATPGVHVLAEQRELAHAVLCEARHLDNHVAGTAADLTATHGR